MFPSDTSDSAYDTPNPKGEYLAYILAVQNNHKLLRVLEKRPWLLTKPHPDTGNYLTHTLASLGYRKLLMKTLEMFPQVVDLLSRQKREHLLHLSVVHPILLKSLLKHEKNIPVNTLDKNGNTPLSLSITHGVFTSYEKLLTTTHTDPNITTPLPEACLILKYQKDSDVRKWLTLGLKHGMALGRITDAGWHALAYSVVLHRLDCFRILVEEYNLDINSSGPQYNHSLFQILTHIRKPLPVLEWSRSRGMDFNIRNSAWETPAEVYRRHWGENAHAKTLRFLHQQAKTTRIGPKESPTDYIFPGASSDHPTIAFHAAYSASMNHIVFFLADILRRHKDHVSLQTTPLIKHFVHSDIDSEEVLRMKYRLKSIQEYSRKMDCFIEYSSPLVYYLPVNTGPIDTRLHVFIFSILGKHGNHSNLLLIDPVLHLIERFDPEGNHDDALDNFIQEKFDLDGYTFISPATIRYPYQLIESARGDTQPGDPIGYCTAWCMWYLEFRAKNRELHPSVIWDTVKDRLLSSDIRQHIRTYALGLSERRNRTLTSLLGKESRNKESSFNEEECSKIRRSIDAICAKYTRQHSKK